MSMKERYINMSSNKKVASKKVPEKKKNVKKISPKKKMFTTENILLVVFGILLIIVIVLGVMVFNKSREHKNDVNANLVVPIFEINAEQNISLTTTALANEEEYILKITNYKDDKVIAEAVNYTITVENDSKAVVKVTRNNSDTDLMMEQKKTVIESQKLKREEKEDVYYHISITKKDGIRKDDKINIKIAS